MGEGTPEQRLRRNPLSHGERAGVRGDLPGSFRHLALCGFCLDFGASLAMTLSPKVNNRLDEFGIGVLDYRLSRTGQAPQSPTQRKDRGTHMPEELQAHRWVMTAVGAPFSSEPFVAQAGPGEVVVAIAGCGVCHTDLGYLYDGVRTTHPLPLALGHEISGRVVAAGEGAEGWLGKAVIVPAVLPCGECDRLQARPAQHLPQAKDAGQRHPWRLRLPYRGAGARTLHG